MPVAEAAIRTLLDREIMLTCLAEAVREEPAGAATLAFEGQLLEVQIRAARTGRVALLQRAGAQAMLAEATPAPGAAERYRSYLAVRTRLATARLVLELRRAELEVNRCEAADLRSNAHALRGEARQVRRRARRRSG